LITIKRIKYTSVKRK